MGKKLLALLLVAALFNLTLISDAYCERKPIDTYDFGKYFEEDNDNSAIFIIAAAAVVGALLLVYARRGHSSSPATGESGVLESKPLALQGQIEKPPTFQEQIEFMAVPGGGVAVLRW